MRPSDWIAIEFLATPKLLLRAALLLKTVSATPVEEYLIRLPMPARIFPSLCTAIAVTVPETLAKPESTSPVARYRLNPNVPPTRILPSGCTSIAFTVSPGLAANPLSTRVPAT